MGDTVNFLEQRSNKALRRELINITNSYSNYWDILCELTQNSFDAIKRYVNRFGIERRAHSIYIEIDSLKRLIRIKDTGIGIKSDMVKDILGPNGTDKDGENESIGEKGVGLTYAIFSCNDFHIETQTPETFFRVK